MSNHFYYDYPFIMSNLTKSEYSFILGSLLLCVTSFILGPWLSLWIQNVSKQIFRLSLMQNYLNQQNEKADQLAIIMYSFMKGEWGRIG